ncbi:MAG: DNA recombination protein RmuC [Thermodesulfovibrionales bacterium]|nr:DNA recombination protein RmuC [Thermodesulfovibrionales bacterium]
MPDAAYLIAGLIGGVIGWVVAWLFVKARLEGRARGAEALASDRERQIANKEAELERVRSELGSEKALRAASEESQRNLSEQKKFLEDTEQRLRDAFGSLASDALARNSEQLNEKLEGKKGLIDQNLDAIAKTLSEVQKKIVDVEKGSVEVSTLVKTHTEITTKLKDTTEHLRHAFASPKKRGEWGERMAEDIIRLIGMAEGINYSKQKTVEGASSRPDYTFLLPNGLKVNMDVKFPLDNYQHYLDAQTEHERKRYKDELLKNTKTMIKQVTNRDYINPEDNTVDYVMLFVPNEQVYSFINESDLTIMDEALKQKVILCSPITLYAVLAVIRQAVENFKLEKTASEILKLLVEFSKQWKLYKEKFEAMGKRLDDAKNEYDALLTTRGNMLEKQLKKIEELGKQKAIALDAEMNLDEPHLL